MRSSLYRITCLTNLHMGSGDANYSVVDLEVERDPVLGEPTMNASGVKGALRDYCRGKEMAAEDVTFIFGSEGSGDQQGHYNFFSGDLLARPVRVTDGNGAWVLATTPELIRHTLNKITAFGLCNASKIPLPAPEDGKCLTPVSNLRSVEGIAVSQCTECPIIGQLLGTDRWVIMTEKQLERIHLPVMVHNVLQDHISKNLWYEEVVPHESVFALLISSPDGHTRLDNLLNNGVVQFGAGATTGNGFTRVSKVEVKA